MVRKTYLKCLRAVLVWQVVTIFQLLPKTLEGFYYFMEQNIKDYLHLYLGCNIQLKDGSIEKLKCVDTEISLVNMGWGNAQDFDDIKPILRPMSDMTDEDRIEMQKIHDIIFWKEDKRMSVSEAERYRYLLSKHFDLFGLIESGLAVDATTLKETAK